MRLNEMMEKSPTVSIAEINHASIHTKQCLHNADSSFATCIDHRIPPIDINQIDINVISLKKSLDPFFNRKLNCKEQWTYT